ncbi:hypothetical protein BIW11_03674 [Tropilaelaps mercedesae]|uniref:Uncharacterized protein n=1 Tax=Tropilaelaps mercedesae TaxID=418985 RepID=A0A1V9XHS6_9ACAR|nr:hypothetical protein BIW11_03674 [Tropilaelaps mercedesae]
MRSTGAENNVIDAELPRESTSPAGKNCYIGADMNGVASRLKLALRIGRTSLKAPKRSTRWTGSYYFRCSMSSKVEATRGDQAKTKAVDPTNSRDAFFNRTLGTVKCHSGYLCGESLWRPLGVTRHTKGKRSVRCVTTFCMHICPNHRRAPAMPADFRVDAEREFYLAGTTLTARKTKRRHATERVI